MVQRNPNVPRRIARGSAALMVTAAAATAAQASTAAVVGSIQLVSTTAVGTVATSRSTGLQPGGWRSLNALRNCIAAACA